MADLPALRGRWTAFTVASAVAAVTLLDASKINVPLPSIQRAFGADSIELQLMLAAYMLTQSLGLVPFGRIGDHGLRRRLLLAGLVGFLAASLVCALAPNTWTLIAGRGLQGVAAGMVMPQAIGVIQSEFHGPERGRAFGLFAAISGATAAIGPTAGGLMMSWGGSDDAWRGLFWFNVPFALVLIPLVLRFVPRGTRIRESRVDIDPIGTITLGVAVVALLLPFVLTSSQGEGPGDGRWLLLIAAAGFGAVFIVWERRYERIGRRPLVALHLFRSRSFTLGVLIIAVYSASAPSMFAPHTMFLQHGLGFPPTLAGVVSIGFASTSAFVSWLTTRRNPPLGNRSVLVGLGVVGVGLVLAAVAAWFLPKSVTGWGMFAALIVVGAGAGLLLPVNQRLTLEDIPPDHGGVAGSIGQLGQRIGNAIGVATAGAAFFSTVASRTGESAYVVYRDGYVAAILTLVLLVALAVVVATLALIRQRTPARAPAATRSQAEFALGSPEPSAGLDT